MTLSLWWTSCTSGSGQKLIMNVIAQEFGEVFPDYVQSSGETLEDGEEILQVDSYPLTIYTAAAVQELHEAVRAKGAEVSSLRAQVAAQKSRMKALEARLATLEAEIR